MAFHRFLGTKQAPMPAAAVDVNSLVITHHLLIAMQISLNVRITYYIIVYTILCFFFHVRELEVTSNQNSLYLPSERYISELTT